MKTQERIGSSLRLTPAGRMYGFLIRLNPLKARFSCFPPRRGEAFSLASPPRRVNLGVGIWDSSHGGGSLELPSRIGPREFSPRRVLFGASTMVSTPAKPLPRNLLS